MPFYILLFIHHAAAEGLLVGLALEYLLLYRPRLEERESELKHSWDMGVKGAPCWESVTDQMAVKCQDRAAPCQTSTHNRQVLLGSNHVLFGC